MASTTYFIGERFHRWVVDELDAAEGRWPWLDATEMAEAFQEHDPAAGLTFAAAYALAVTYGGDAYAEHLRESFCPFPNLFTWV